MDISVQLILLQPSLHHYHDWAPPVFNIPSSIYSRERMEYPASSWGTKATELATWIQRSGGYYHTRCSRNTFNKNHSHWCLLGIPSPGGVVENIVSQPCPPFPHHRNVYESIRGDGRRIFPYSGQKKNLPSNEPHIHAGDNNSHVGEEIEAHLSPQESLKLSERIGDENTPPNHHKCHSWTVTGRLPNRGAECS